MIYYAILFKSNPNNLISNYLIFYVSSVLTDKKYVTVKIITSNRWIIIMEGTQYMEDQVEWML